MSRPALRCYLNWLAIEEMPAFLAGPKGLSPEWPSCAIRAIWEAGYDGIQWIEPADPPLIEEARKAGLGVCGSGRVNEPADSYRLAEQASALGLECLTLHVGWGIEDDGAAHVLIRSVLEARRRFGVPLYVETHRATIFQDMWRTVNFLKSFPDLEFNGDFSHWYTGSEMVYGGFERKLEFIRPVIERVRFIHGRIGNPGCMQVALGSDVEAEPFYAAHFRRLWTEVFSAWLRTEPSTFFCFAAELLAPSIFYARTFAGQEESDRWQQSLLLCRIGRECFAEAQNLQRAAEG
jgi:hypothetical protein